MKKNIIFIMSFFCAWTMVGSEEVDGNQYYVATVNLQKNIQNYKYYSMVSTAACISSAGLCIYSQVASPENVVNLLGFKPNLIIPMILGAAAIYSSRKVHRLEDLLEYTGQLSEPQVFRCPFEGIDYTVINKDHLSVYLQLKDSESDVDLYTQEGTLLIHAHSHMA